jgi:hypothetical protein
MIVFFILINNHIPNTLTQTVSNVGRFVDRMRLPALCLLKLLLDVSVQITMLAAHFFRKLPSHVNEYAPQQSPSSIIRARTRGRVASCFTKIVPIPKLYVVLVFTVTFFDSDQNFFFCPILQSNQSIRR